MRFLARSTIVAHPSKSSPIVMSCVDAERSAGKALTKDAKAAAKIPPNFMA